MALTGGQTFGHVKEKAVNAEGKPALIRAMGHVSVL